ncbi:SGNH/GDSL hydrolase family protein [Rhodocyclus gracilis]|nr:SGNH/GDSL hydrolase family protein [Rhodocyclus gracilis]
MKPAQTILFIGDSITDSGRTQNDGAPLGRGYVQLFADLLTLRKPQEEFRIINKGIDCNTIAHLLSRWSDDVIENAPDVVYILIGINDATRHLDQSRSLHRAPDDFAAVYRRLVEETRKRLPHASIILMEPFFISKGDDIEGSYRQRLIVLLQDYIAATRSVAAACHTGLIKLSEIFTHLVAQRNSAFFSEDKIHPTSAGHLAIAEAAYRALPHGRNRHV